jgi:biotin-(acetyl-CoA carboxylase) ligase
LRVRLAKEEFTGTFRDLDGDGSLLVEQSDGTLRHVSAGEVFLPSI